MSKIKTRTARTVGLLKQVWDDMDYAQRRLLELNFEIPLDFSNAAATGGPQTEDSEASHGVDARARAA